MTISITNLTVTPDGSITATVTATAPGSANLILTLSTVNAPTPILVSFHPSAAFIPDNSPIETVVATVSVSMSDGSAFTGTLAATPSGTVTISGNNLVLARALTSADDGSLTWVVSASQNGATISGLIPVQVSPAGPIFTVTPNPAVTGSNITISVTGDPGGNYFRLLDPNGNEIQRTSNTPFR